MIGRDSNRTLVLPADMGLNEVTKEAYTYFGDSGIIHLANGHECSECTHTYKQRADLIINLDPAAVVGCDEGRAVPQLVGGHATTLANDAIQASRDRSGAASNAPVTMVVMDGVVMGPTVSLLLFSFVFCNLCEIQYGSKCHVCGCSNDKISGTQACVQHQNEWQQFINGHNQCNLSGFH